MYLFNSLFTASALLTLPNLNGFQLHHLTLPHNSGLLPLQSQPSSSINNNSPNKIKDSLFQLCVEESHLYLAGVMHAYQLMGKKIKIIDRFPPNYDDAESRSSLSPWKVFIKSGHALVLEYREAFERKAMLKAEDHCAANGLDRVDLCPKSKDTIAYITKILAITPIAGILFSLMTCAASLSIKPLAFMSGVKLNTEPDIAYPHDKSRDICQVGQNIALKTKHIFDFLEASFISSHVMIFFGIFYFTSSQDLAKGLARTQKNKSKEPRYLPAEKEEDDSNDNSDDKGDSEDDEEEVETTYLNEWVASNLNSANLNGECL